MVKSTKIGQNSTDGHNFDRIKIEFSESSHHYLPNDMSYAWFRGGPSLPIILVMTSFLCISVGLYQYYSSAKVSLG